MSHRSWARLAGFSNAKLIDLYTKGCRNSFVGMSDREGAHVRETRDLDQHIRAAYREAQLDRS